MTTSAFTTAPLTTAGSTVDFIAALSAPSLAALQNRVREITVMSLEEQRNELLVARDNFDSLATYRLALRLCVSPSGALQTSILQSVLGTLDDTEDRDGLQRLDNDAFLGIGPQAQRLAVLVSAPIDTRGQALAPNLAEQFAHALLMSARSLGVPCASQLNAPGQRARTLGWAYRSMFRHFAIEVDAFAGAGLGELTALALAGRVQHGPTSTAFDELAPWPPTDELSLLTADDSGAGVVYAAQTNEMYPTDPKAAYETLSTSVKDVGTGVQQMHNLAAHGARVLLLLGPQRSLFDDLDAYNKAHALGLELIQAHRADLANWSGVLTELTARGFVGRLSRANPAAPIDPALPAPRLDPVFVHTLEHLVDASHEAVHTLNRLHTRADNLHAEFLVSQSQTQRVIGEIGILQARLISAVEALSNRTGRSVGIEHSVGHPDVESAIERRTTTRISVAELGHRHLTPMSKGAEFWIVDGAQTGGGQLRPLGNHVQDALRIHQIPARIVDVTARPRGQRISGILFIAPQAPGLSFLRNVLGILSAFNAALDSMVRRRTVVLIALPINAHGDAPLEDSERSLGRALTALQYCARELAPWSRFKMLQLESEPQDFADLAAEVADEILLDGPTAVAITEGARYAVRVAPKHRNASPNNSPPLSEEDTVVSVAPPGSFTCELAIALARHTGCSLALLGPDTIAESGWLNGCTSPAQVRQALAQHDGLHAANGLEQAVDQVMSARATRELLASTAKAGIRAQYFTVSALDGRSLADAIARANDQLGVLTGAMFDVRGLHPLRDPGTEDAREDIREDIRHERGDLIDEVLERVRYAQSLTSVLANQSLRFCAALGAMHEAGSTITAALCLEAAAGPLSGLMDLLPNCQGLVMRWNLYERQRQLRTAINPDVVQHFLSELAPRTSAVRIVEFAKVPPHPIAAPTDAKATD